MDEVLLIRTRCKKCDDVIISYLIDKPTWCKCGAVGIGSGNDHQKHFYSGGNPSLIKGDEVMGRPIMNRVRCKRCGDIIRSVHTHDFVNCKCDSIAVDGGNEYQRLTGEPEDMDLSWSVYEGQKVDVARGLSNMEYRLLLQVHESFISTKKSTEQEEHHLSNIVEILRNVKEDCLEVYFSNGYWYQYYRDGTIIEGLDECER